MDILSTLALEGVLTPSALSADVNNYNPTGLDRVSVIRQSSNGEWNVTGLAGGVSGRILILANMGVRGFILVNESASSTAANRFQLVSDLTLWPNDSVILRYDGTLSRWTVLSVRTAITKVTVLTSGTGFTPTVGVKAMWVEVIAGGGGGAGATAAASAIAAGGGGGGGAYSAELFLAPFSASYTIQIGQGGAGGIAANGTGTAGGQTFFAAAGSLAANGGFGGLGMASGSTPLFTTSAGGGLIGNGTVNLRGGAGGPGMRLSGTIGCSGFGGMAARGGGGGGGINAQAVGNAGNSPGAGGGGAISGSTSGFAGGAGADGCIIITEFF